MTRQTFFYTFFDRLCTVSLRDTELMDKDYIITSWNGSKSLVIFICPVRTPPEMDTNSVDFLNFQLWLLKDISAA